MPVTYRPSPNEIARLLQQERENRRKLRMKQVREQANITAAKIRHAVKQEREKQILKLAEQLKSENEEKRESALEALQEKYSETLKTIGSAHRAAIEEDYEGQERDRWLIHCENQERADQRQEIALLQQEQERKEKLAEETRHIVARKRALCLERLRAAEIASMPPPPPDPIQLLQPPKVKPVKMTDQNAFATTYYHLGPECIAEREHSSDLPNAHTVAAEIEDRMREKDEEKKRSQLEQQEKALLRHRNALHQELLRQDYDRLMQDLSDLQRVDREKRQKVLHTLPKQIFQPPHRLVEEKLGKQRELERAFEQMYFLETNYAGDLSLALEPSQPDLSTPRLSYDGEIDRQAATKDGELQPSQETGRPPMMTDGTHAARLIDHDKTPDTALRKLMNRIRSQRETTQADVNTTSSSFTSEENFVPERRSLTSSDSSSSTPSTLPPDAGLTQPVNSAHGYQSTRMPYEDDTRGDNEQQQRYNNGYSYQLANTSSNKDVFTRHDAFHNVNNHALSSVDHRYLADDDNEHETLTPIPSPHSANSRNSTPRNGFTAGLYSPVQQHAVGTDNNFSQPANRIAARSTLDTDEYYAFLEKQRQELMQMRSGTVDSHQKHTENDNSNSTGPYFSRTEQLDLSADSVVLKKSCDNDKGLLNIRRRALFSDDDDIDDNSEDGDGGIETHQRIQFDMQANGLRQRLNEDIRPLERGQHRSSVISSKHFKDNTPRDIDMFNDSIVHTSLIQGPVAGNRQFMQHASSATAVSHVDQQSELDDLEARRTQINELLTQLNRQRGELEERSRSHEEEMERLQKLWKEEMEIVRQKSSVSARFAPSFVSDTSFNNSETNRGMPKAPIEGMLYRGDLNEEDNLAGSKLPYYSSQLLQQTSGRKQETEVIGELVSRRLTNRLPQESAQVSDQRRNIVASALLTSQPSLSESTAAESLRRSTTTSHQQIADIGSSTTLSESRVKQTNVIMPIGHTTCKLLEVPLTEDSHQDDMPTAVADVSLNVSSFVPSDDGIVINTASSFSGVMTDTRGHDVVHDLPPLPGYSSYTLSQTKTNAQNMYPKSSVSLTVSAHNTIDQLSSLPSSKSTVGTSNSVNIQLAKESSRPPVQGSNATMSHHKLNYNVGIVSQNESTTSHAEDVRRLSANKEDSMFADQGTWQNELEQYSLSSKSSANSSRHSTGSKNVSFDVTQGHLISHQSSKASPAPISQPLMQADLMANSRLAPASLPASLYGASQQRSLFAAEQCVVEPSDLDTSAANIFQPLIADRWMNYLQRDSNIQSELNDMNQRWSMPNEWHSAVTAGTHHVSDPGKPVESSLFGSNAVTVDGKFKLPVTDVKRPYVSSFVSASSGRTDQSRQIAALTDDELGTRPAGQGIDDVIDDRKNSYSSQSSASLSQHSLPDSLSAASEQHADSRLTPAYDGVQAGMLHGITDEPELSFVALSSTMSTPQRQPQLTSSPAAAIPRDRKVTALSVHQTPDHYDDDDDDDDDNDNDDVGITEATEDAAATAGDASKNQSSSLASFEQHEKSLSSTAETSGPGSGKVEDSSGSGTRKDESSTCTASWSVVSDGAIVKVKISGPNEQVSRRPASAGDNNSGRQLASIPITQLTDQAGKKTSHISHDGNAHLNQVLSSWKQSRPVRSSQDAGKGNGIGSTPVVAKHHDPTNIVEYTSAERKQAEKKMLTRTKRLYDQLEEVKVKNTELERRKQYAKNREKARDFNQKHKDLLKKKSNTCDKKNNMCSGGLPVSVS